MGILSSRRMITGFLARQWRSLYFVLMTVFATVLIGCNAVAKHGWDLFPVIVIGWWICSVRIVRYSTSAWKAAALLALFVLLDGLIDSLSTGMWKWIGPPWILVYDYFSYPFRWPTHPITAAYLVTLWVLAIPLRSLAIGAYFVAGRRVSASGDAWGRPGKLLDEAGKRIALFYLIGWAIVSSVICDWVNFAVRPQIPEFDVYIPPLGFWTLERMVVRTASFLIFGAWCFHLAVRERETRSRTIAIAVAAILALNPITFLVASLI
jgi:hypothetical protein